MRTCQARQGQCSTSQRSRLDACMGDGEEAGWEMGKGRRRTMAAPPSAACRAASRTTAARTQRTRHRTELARAVRCRRRGLLAPSRRDTPRRVHRCTPRCWRARHRGVGWRWSPAATTRRRPARAHAVHMQHAHAHAHAVHMQCTCSAHALHMQCTCSAHAHAVYMQCTCACSVYAHAHAHAVYACTRSAYAYVRAYLGLVRRVGEREEVVHRDEAALVPRRE